MKTKMKTKGLGEKQPKGPKRPEGQQKKGVALLTVLTVMSLATILVLTFFTLAQSELESSTSYSQGMEAKHLSETAVNMVIEQLRMATTNEGSGSRNYAWASQPGALRVYEEDGSFKAGFKLYSDELMVERNSETKLVEDDRNELGAWETSPAVFVDLNEPVIRGDKVFYPIVDPRAKDVQEIEGFDYKLDGVAPGPLNGAVEKATKATGEEAHTLPMPVKWLYQLKDGSIGHMVGSGKGTYQALSGGDASRENPIVGRVAFWADDETTKLNINTASGGLAWDTPRAGGDFDRRVLAMYQPAQHEWQRYPGHPATTSLAPIFFPNYPGIMQKQVPLEAMYSWTPRVVGGGTLGGTAQFKEPTGLVADKDRLYPSLDEFILRPDREKVQGGKAILKFGVDPGGEGRFENGFVVPKKNDSYTIDYYDSEEVARLLERSRFFLTATSRAPEVTLFNTPRITMWPTYNKKSKADDKYATAFDELIRYAGELGEDSGSGYVKRFQYYFQRENADSPTHDFYGIKRNQELYVYLDKLMEADIPGFGGDFKAKYGHENKQQLLTSIFDYIRSTNLFDDTLYADDGDDNAWKAAFLKDNANDHLTYTNYRIWNSNQADLTDMHMGHGQVTPITISHPIGGTFDEFGEVTKGYGRFPTVAEVAVHLICCAAGKAVPFQGDGDSDASNPSLNDDPHTFKIDGGGDKGVPYPGEDIRGRRTRNDTVVAYSNFPPLQVATLKMGTDLPDDPWTNPYHPAVPEWLKKVHKADILNGTKIAEEAIKPENWNHQLALADGKTVDLPKYTAQSVADSEEMRLHPRWPAYPLKDPRKPGFVPATDIAPADGDPAERVVQAALLFRMYIPSQGWTGIRPDFKFSVDTDGLNFDGVTFPAWSAGSFQEDGVPTWVAGRHSLHRGWGMYPYGGMVSCRGLMRGDRSSNRYAPFDQAASGANPYEIYPWVTPPYVITESSPGSGFSVNIGGGAISR